jgi:hypothetical protein
MSKAIARRFIVMSTVTMVLLAAVVAAFAIAGPVLLSSRDPAPGQLVGYFGSIGLIVLMVGVLAFRTRRLTAAMRAIAAAHPDGVVFLARRHPSVVSDLETFMRERGFEADVSDGWVPALVDGRGISAWSTGSQPRELLLISWGELGEIAVEPSLTALSDGRPNVTVDVRPFVVPLTVDLGFARGILTFELDAVDTKEAVRITNSLRPAAHGAPAGARIEAPAGRAKAADRGSGT